MRFFRRLICGLIFGHHNDHAKYGIDCKCKNCGTKIVLTVGWLGYYFEEVSNGCKEVS